MRLCIDTNAYVSFKQARSSLVHFLEEADEIFLPAVVVGELYAGFFMGKKFDQNVRELNQFLAQPGISLISITASVAEYYGKLVASLKARGTPIPTNDIWIAASALDTGTRLVSYDDHFKHIQDLIVHAP